MRRPVTTFALAVGMASLAACLDDSITGTRPLTFALTASPAAPAVGDSVTIGFQATGTSIFGVVVAFGDGAADTAVAETSSLVQWADEFKHVYSDPGTYSVVGRVDTSAGTRSDTIEVVVSGGT